MSKEQKTEKKKKGNKRFPQATSSSNYKFWLQKDTHDSSIGHQVSKATIRGIFL